MWSLSTPFSLDFRSKIWEAFILFPENLFLCSSFCFPSPNPNFSSLSLAYLTFHHLQLLPRWLQQSSFPPWCSPPFCCCEYFIPLAMVYRSHEMKELPIRKWAALLLYMPHLGFTIGQTRLRSSVLSFQPHFTTPASQPASSHLPWHEQSAWTTDIVSEEKELSSRAQCVQCLLWNNSVKIWNEAWETYSSCFSMCPRIFVYFSFSRFGL